MSPVAQSDRHDAPGLVDDGVPGVTAVVEDVGVGCEDAVAEPVVAHELPEVLDRVESGGARRQRQQGDVGRHSELPGGVPAGLIEQQDGVCAGGDGLGDLGQMQGHRLGGAERHDEAGPGASGRADRPEDVGRGGALVLGRRGARAASGPAAGDRVFLTDPGLVGESDLYWRAADGRRDRLQAGAEAFLKAGMVSGSWAWWRGRAESLR